MALDYESLGTRIREYRKRLGLTQARLAELSGVEPSNISHIERAATKVSLPTLIRIANVLGASLDELVYGSILQNAHVSAKEIDRLLSDCSPEELKAITEMVKATKQVLRSR